MGSNNKFMGTQISDSQYVRQMKQMKKEGSLPTTFLRWRESVDNIYRTRFRNGGVNRYVTDKHLYLGYRSKLSPLSFVLSRVYHAEVK